MQARASYNQLKKLQSIRNQATIITEKPTGDTVQIGCRVRYSRSDFSSDDEVIMGSYFVIDSTDDEVSARSPLGQLLMGAKVGDSIKGEIGGCAVTLTVKTIKVAEEFFAVEEAS